MLKDMQYVTGTEEMWQQGAQRESRQWTVKSLADQASSYQIRDSISPQSMSSEARPASCAGARLSHQPHVPQETNTGEPHQLLPESTKRLGL